MTPETEDNDRQQTESSPIEKYVDSFPTDEVSLPEIPRENVMMIGDLHACDPKLLLEDLIQARILSTNGKWVFDGFVVQMGDIIDRGSHFKEIRELMDDLQLLSEGRLIRLLGNHDLYHAYDDAFSLYHADLRTSETIEYFHNAILDRRLIAAWGEGDIIYTHAGIDLDFFPEYLGKSNRFIIADLNNRLFNAALSNDFLSDPIFDSERGIFWTRGNIENNQFRQRVGHTPQKSGITVNPGVRVGYVDGGRVFSGLIDGLFPDARKILPNTEEFRRRSLDPREERCFPSQWKMSADGRVSNVPERFAYYSGGRWEPDENMELCPAIPIEDYETSGFVRVEEIDLYSLAPGSLVYISGTIPCGWTIQIRENHQICIWQELNSSRSPGRTTGLVGRLFALGSMDSSSRDKENETVDLFPGRLFVQGSRVNIPEIIFPQFDYDHNGNVNASLDKYIERKANLILVRPTT